MQEAFAVNLIKESNANMSMECCLIDLIFYDASVRLKSVFNEFNLKKSR